MKYVDNWSLEPCEREIIKKNVTCYLMQFEGENLKLVNKILEKLTVVNINEFNRNANSFKKNVKKFMSEHKEIGVFCIVDELEKPHHSYGFLQYFSGMENVRTSVYLKDDLDYEFNKYEEVLLIDDYSGSGQSFCEAIKLINDSTLNKKKIYISCMYMTSFAKSNITNFCINNNLFQIEIIFNDSWTQLRSDFIKECCLFSQKDILQFEKICVEICGLNQENIYGFGSVGDGVSFVNWTPNTTIPMLWQNGKKYVAIFSRSDYPFGNKKFWKKADITKLKGLAINKMYYIYASVAFMLVAGYDYKKIMSFNNINEQKLESIISSLCINKCIKCIEYDGTKIFEEEENYFKLIDKEKYYKFIHGVNVEKTVKINLISAIKNRN